MFSKEETALSTEKSSHLTDNTEQKLKEAESAAAGSEVRLAASEIFDGIRK